MTVLHTSDWHLGHRLYERDRTAEHRAFLEWLLDTIRERRVELLVVAGDVFDSMNPSNTARGLYYDFLARLRNTDCHNVVIVGGNHDSPSLLDAPAELMAYLRIHVVGGARAEVTRQIFPIYRTNAEHPELLVAAVPFLRDRDLKYSVIGETASDRVTRLRAAIRRHYEEVGEAAGASQKKYRGPRGAIPVLATGHLFVAGSEDAEDKQSNIYLADRNNIEAGHFPAVFDYVALGHIHRAQSVGGSDRIRYSGSPVPLTFGEARMRQSVCLLELDAAGAPVVVDQLPVPTRRDLLTVRGTLDEVKTYLEELTARQRVAPARQFRPWLEVRVVSPYPLPLLRQDLRALLSPTPEEAAAGEDYLPQLLGVRTERPATAGEETHGEDDARSLAEWQPEEVFARLCGEDHPERTALLEDFRELRGWMAEKQGS